MNDLSLNRTGCLPNPILHASWSAGADHHHGSSFPHIKLPDVESNLLLRWKKKCGVTRSWPEPESNRLPAVINPPRLLMRCRCRPPLRVLFCYIPTWTKLSNFWVRNKKWQETDGKDPSPNRTGNLLQCVQFGRGAGADHRYGSYFLCIWTAIHWGNFRDNTKKKKEYYNGAWPEPESNRLPAATLLTHLWSAGADHRYGSCFPFNWTSIRLRKFSVRKKKRLESRQDPSPNRTSFLL
jgi:hypothetical protein